ncbi:ankyrin [Neocallimastix lanati (nom. inval.)]|nr:ankyrin [Neocallimastix sp. JGI-2020a]
MDKFQELKQIIESQNIIDYKSFFLYGSANLNEINSDTFDLLIYLIENKCSNEFIEFTSQQYPTLDYTSINEKIPLFLAIENEYFSIANILLNHGASINYHQENTNHSILFYLYSKKVLKDSMLYFILKKGIDINYEDKSNDLFLLNVIRKDDITLLRKIINFYEFDNEMILSLVTLYHNKKSLSKSQLNALIESEKKKLNFSDKMYYTAISKNNLGILKLLYHSDCQESLEKINHHSGILNEACSYPNTYKIINYLINEQKIDINEKNGNKKITPLMMASGKGYTDYVRLLIENGADVNARDSKNFTPLMFATQCDNKSIIELLVEHGADVNAVSKDSYTALILACEEGNLEISRYLIEKGADINAKDSRRTTSLMNAIRSGNKELVDYLLSNKNLTINVKDYNGWNALMTASYRGQLDTVKALYEKGESIHEKDANGFSSLMLACLNGCKNVVNFLLEQDIDVNDTNQAGSTALMVVSQNGQKEIAKALLDHGASIDVKDKQGCSALIYATTVKQSGMVNLLLQHGANINIQNKKGDSPIIIACNNGSKELIRLLAYYGADLNMKNAKNLTPLQITQKRGFHDLSNFLMHCGAQDYNSQYYL